MHKKQSTRSCGQKLLASLMAQMALQCDEAITALLEFVCRQELPQFGKDVLRDVCSGPEHTSEPLQKRVPCVRFAKWYSCDGISQ